MIIQNPVVAKLIADHIDQVTAKLKVRLVNMQPNAPQEAQHTWSLRGEIQALEKLKKELLEDDEHNKE